MKALWSKTLKPGEKWSGSISRGHYVLFKALGANANVALLLYNMRDTSERYNMPDTLKAQHTSFLTRGDVLMSDNGRVLASIVQDSVGWHDTITGLTTRKATDAKYGKTTYQKQRNDWLRCGLDNVRMELERNGMSARDLVPNVNLFSKVYVEEDGTMRYVPGWCSEGDTVTLRTEMDCVFILSNTPCSQNPSEAWPSVPVQVTLYDAPETDLLDECVQKRPENFRAYENTWDYYTMLGL